MEPEIDQAVAIGIALVLLIIWLTAVRFMLSATRERQAHSDDSSHTNRTDNPPGTIVGSADVVGQPDVLAATLVEQLERDGLGFLGPIKITSADDREVRFEAIGGSPAAGSHTPGGIRCGSIQFTGAGNNTWIEYRVEAVSGRVLLGLGWLFIALGLAAIMVGLCLMLTFVIPNAQAAHRPDAFQMIGALHLVWPPFLFGHLARQSFSLVRGQFEALINNLPYA